MEYLSYRKFKTEEEALDFCELLKKNQVDYVCEKDVVTLDSVYGENGLSSGFHVKVQSSDFERANKIMEANTPQIHLDQVEKDYYLFEFSNQELLDLVKKRDEWSEFDFLLSKKILTSRGIEINDSKQLELDKERALELSKSDNPNRIWVILGYAFALLGGIVAIFFGYVLHTTKKTLPNGQRVHAFSEEDRKHGTRIFVIGLVVLFSFLIKWLMK